MGHRTFHKDIVECYHLPCLRLVVSKHTVHFQTGPNKEFICPINHKHSILTGHKASVKLLLTPVQVVSMCLLCSWVRIHLVFSIQELDCWQRSPALVALPVKLFGRCDQLAAFI